MGKFDSAFKKHEHLLEYKLMSGEELMEKFPFFKKKDENKNDTDKPEKNDNNEDNKDNKHSFGNFNKKKTSDDNTENGEESKSIHKDKKDNTQPNQNKIKENKKHSLKSISGESASLIFGRFSPPTLGHKALIDSVKYNGPVILCIINGISTKNRKEKDENGNLKNPFSFKTKLQVIESWNDDNIYVIQYTGRAYLPNIIKSIYNKYKIRIKNVVMGEETKSFKHQLVSAIESGDNLFKNITINSVQRTEGYSGTAARKSLVDNNMSEFTKLTGLKPESNGQLIDELSKEVHYVLDQPKDLPVNTITADQDVSLMTPENSMDEDISLDDAANDTSDEDISLDDNASSDDPDVSLEDSTETK